MACQVRSSTPWSKRRPIAPGAPSTSRHGHKGKFTSVKFDLITQTVFHIAGIFCTALAVKGRWKTNMHFSMLYIEKKKNLS